MHADLESILWTFGSDPAICLREEAICAKVYRQTDRQTDDGRRAIALAHSWNELKMYHLSLILVSSQIVSSAKTKDGGSERVETTVR